MRLKKTIFNLFLPPWYYWLLVWERWIQSVGILVLLAMGERDRERERERERERLTGREIDKQKDKE